MTRREKSRSGGGSARRWGLTATAGAAAVLLSGCGEAFTRGYLPEPVTEAADEVVFFWNAV